MDATCTRLFTYIENSSQIFIVGRKNQINNVKRYLPGLLRDGLRSKNIERIAESDMNDYYSLQHFISDSPWDHRLLLNNIAHETNELIGGKDAALIIDESGMVKAGKHSVGVARQYLGCIGKVENGQIGVFAALANNNKHCLIDADLYLHRTWTDDVKRMKKAGVPEEFQTYRSVTDIALSMVKRAKENGIHYGYVVTDAKYGQNMDFSLEIADLGDIFLTDIACDYSVYTAKPKFKIPQYRGRGRKPTTAKAQLEAVRVDKIAKGLNEKDWKKITVRQGTKGSIQYNYFFQRVWCHDARNNSYVKLTLIIRHDPSTDTYKYTLTNAPAYTKKTRLAYMQASRYWVERSFQEAKNSTGMAQYQVRGWRAWNHHMALVSMAMNFILKEKLLAEDEEPLLSCTDITELIAVSVSQKLTYEDVITRIHKRHEQRHRDIEYAKRRQKKSYPEGFV